MNTVDQMYFAMDGSEFAEKYSARHGIESAAILTVYDDETADLIAGYLADRVRGKVVVEIGSGIGLLAMHIAQYAERIYCIEADPSWTMVFLKELYSRKPKNVSWLFGSADEFAGMIKADVAFFCTHSDRGGMAKAGRLFAPVVIDVYQEILGAKHIEKVEREARAEAERILGVTP